MKDEEIADKKYCKDCKLRMEQCLWAWRRTNGLNEPNEKTCSCKEVPAFLAGLKAGRPQWHDLRKNPTDLPPKMVSNHNFSIEVLSDKGEIVCYNFHYCEWFYWRSGSPIAWCELPTFDKE